MCGLQQLAANSLTCQLAGGSWVPPSLHADDFMLLATPAAGPQRQLSLLHRYCQQWASR